MSIQLLRAADRRDEPWLNGGGVTSPVAVSPAGAGAEAFDWRVSIATVAADGPFSHYAGIDRCLAVLQGSMSLAFEDGRAVDLAPLGTPLEFPGDVAVDAIVTEGPVVDLNLMVRRGRWAGTTHRERVAGGFEFHVERPVTLLLGVGAPLTCDVGGQVFVLGETDALLLESEAGASARVSAADGAVLYIVEAWPVT